jgi:integrase
MTINRKKITVKNGISYNGKTYSYVLRIPDAITGKTKPKWVAGFDSEKAAKIARDKARVALSEYNYAEPTRQTVAEYLNAWYEVHSNRIGAEAVEKYARTLRNHVIPRIGSMKLQDLRPLHVERLYTDLLTTPQKSGKCLSPRSVKAIGTILKTAFKYAVEVQGVITVNPVARVKMPKFSGANFTPWTFSELRTFLTQAKSHRLYFFFRLSAFTGARRGELLALKWTDFDGNAITVKATRSALGEKPTTKGGHGQRRVMLDAETITQFNEHRKRQYKERLAIGSAWTETGYVFVQENGLPIYPNTPSDVMKKLSALAGLRHTRLHDLRHLHATELLRLGEPLHVVANRLGHRDAMVTATIYAHVSQEQTETASLRFAEASENM